MYSKLIVYFFSGTGNSRNVGFWLSAEAKRMNMDVTLVNIAGTGSLRMEEVPDKNALIAFVSPVHGFNYPPVMAGKKITPASSGTFQTDNWIFIGLLISVILIVGGLTFFPALSFGPIIEHLLMNGGITF